jgi:tetratricopeptide (TPR) repeat protein
MNDNRLESSILKISKDDITSEIKNLFNEDQSYTFLVGAGISMDPPSCVPSARMFVKDLFKYYAPEEEIGMLSQLDSLRYEFLVEKIQNLFDKELRFLDYLDEVKEPNANHIFLANMIMRLDPVLTTNFDYLLEMGLKVKLSQFRITHPYHQKVMIIITKEDYGKNIQFQFPIIKIHGSKWDCIKGRPTKDSLITTMSALGKDREKGKTFAIEPYKKKLIDKIMLYRNLVVMGYSGSDDFDISPMLKELNGLKRIIWIEHAVDMQGEEISKYLPVGSSKLQINSSFSKQDLLLIELASEKNIEVFKITTNTINFVKTKLAPIFKENFETLNEEQIRKIPSFSEYMKENYFAASESSKYRLAHEIYNELGHTEDAERTALRGLDLAKNEKNDINELYFTNAIGLISLNIGQPENAIEHFEKSLQLTESLNQINEKIGVLLNMGEYYRKKGDLRNALKYIIDASNLTTEQTPGILNFSILNSLGVIYRENGDIQNAIKSIEQALEIAERTGDLSSKALCYNNLAGIYFSQGLLDPALKNASEALRIDELLGDLDDMASNLNTIGNIYMIAGYNNEALSYLERAYKIADKIKKLRIKSLAGNAIGVINFKMGKLDEAMRFYNDSYKIRKDTDDLSGQATSLNNIGLIFRARGDYEKAYNYFNQSIEIAEKMGEKTHLAVRYGNRGSIYEARREFEKALEEYKKAHAMARSQENLHEAANQLFNIGGILGDMGKHDECIDTYTKALSIMEDLKIKPGIAKALNNLGTVLYKFKKDYEKSINLLERAVTIYKEIGDYQMLSTSQRNLDHIKEQFKLYS